MENNILNYNRVENIRHINAKAAFTVNSAAVLREDGVLLPSPRVAQICHRRTVYPPKVLKNKKKSGGYWW